MEFSSKKVGKTAYKKGDEETKGKTRRCEAIRRDKVYARSNNSLLHTWNRESETKRERKERGSGSRRRIAKEEEEKRARERERERED
jgi:hypothetical protein